MVETAVLLCAFSGTLLLLMPWIDEISKGYVKKYENAFSQHIKTLLKVTTGKGGGKQMRIFLFLSAGAGSVVFSLLSGRIGDIVCLTAAVFALLLPYALLRVKLRFIRVESSREGEILITELLENYKINYFNMQRAIEVSAASMEEAPNCRRLLFNLSKGINSAGSNDELKQILDEFRLSINTSWAGILAVNLYFALSSGIEVTHALADLARSVEMARKINEYVKRENNEAKLMLKYLAPICYLLTAAGGIFFFNLSWRKFLLYQFQTAAGLTWFVVSLILYISGVIVFTYISRGKLDL